MKNERIWTALVNIRPIAGAKFEDLVDDNLNTFEIVGPWANVMVNGERILEAYNNIVAGITEKQFAIIYFEYLDDFIRHKENFEIDEDFLEAEELLNNSKFRFCIVGRLFPYAG